MAGALAAATTGGLGSWYYAPTVGWDCAAAVFLAWTWLVVTPMNGDQTATHATDDDPPKRLTQIIVLGASIASLAGVANLLFQAGATTGDSKAAAAALALVSIGVSWLVVHTLFALHYAFLYYTGEDSGVNFNQDGPPRYTDFAYLSFTLGMTFQVSDTTLTTHVFRATALRHALLSYLFGSLVVATCVNLVVSLASSSH